MKEISQHLKCILMRNGIEIWVESEKVDLILPALERVRFIDVDGELINTADITGIHTPERMEEVKRNKGGQWKCKQDRWHDKGKICDCQTKKFDPSGKIIKEFVKGQGWI